MFFLHHSGPQDEGATLEARRFGFATRAEAVAQAKHDLSRPGTAPLVDGIFDEHGKRLMTVKQIEGAS